jgi:hypothetical protein
MCSYKKNISPEMTKVNVSEWVPGMNAHVNNRDGLRTSTLTEENILHIIRRRAWALKYGREKKRLQCIGVSQYHQNQQENRMHTRMH